MKDFKLEVDNYKTVRDAVFESIRKGILNGYFKPGERIIESQLAEKMNVSRTPIREALRRLEVENLVENLPRKGMIVSTLKDSQVIEIFNIRGALEGLAVDIAIDHLDEELINNLQTCIDKMSEAIVKDNIEMQIRYNTKFHEHILCKTDSPMLVNMLHNLKEQIQRYRYQSLSLQGRPEISLNEHKNILKFLKDKNKEEAEKYIKDHIKKAGEALIKNHNLNS
ncbi:MAG: GntR family transcriptional regulator [Bacillota bacterium]|nr:GntR family transcriptional regulator [Bacillota bacterium]